MDYDAWLSRLYKLAHPVLMRCANRTLLDFFPPKPAIECICRTVLGVSPLFSFADAHPLAFELRSLATESLNTVFENDAYGWTRCGPQLMVEMALLCLAFTRFPRLWDAMMPRAQSDCLRIMTHAASYTPYNNNWILFHCMIDVFLNARSTSKRSLVDCAAQLRKFDAEWYAGDGWYKDGPHFRMDYYNSFVIVPFLVDLSRMLDSQLHAKTLRCLQRQSEFLERLISPEGTFPLFGRSMVYRAGAFHALCYAVYLENLPAGLSNGSVRRALSKVLETMFDDDANFDSNGFLRLGFRGMQPELADTYSNVGSVYYALLAFLPLGLMQTAAFWTEEDAMYTQERAWKGLRIDRDAAFTG